ncbi:MAG: DUF3320 domain-containing protein [Kiritimatiellae bacterium]|nr:DUF3320 domain-containing protein [Kiritimatiellia bacterium]
MNELHVEWISSRFLNLALQQNGFSLVPEVTVENTGEGTLSGLICEVSVTPASFAASRTFPVEELARGGKTALRELKIDPDFDALLSLAEPLHGTIALSIRQDDAELFRDERPLDIYTPDQWPGASLLPELTAAFVMPNLPDIQEFVKAVASELEETTGDSAVSGYQQGKARAYAILQACYRVLHKTGIRYAMPPASFDAPGQRLRLPDAVLRDRMGTCIETTLLLASLAEQCGLHPVVMVKHGHAYLGCHLVDSHFPNPATDDLQTIRKRVTDDEFTIVETTKLTEEGVTFSQAETIAKDAHLNDDDAFVCAIDIQRARYSGIRPLPLRSVLGGTFVFEEPPPDPRALRAEGRRELHEAVDLSTLDRASAPGDRLARWQQKLLDLTTRNRLLNVREGKFAVPLLCPEVGAMEDLLAAGKPLVIGPVARLFGGMDENELRKKGFSDFETPMQQVLAGELKQRRLWSPLSEKELDRSLKALYRESRTDLEEGGVNTLFLALGFLEWTMATRAGMRYHAPILLVPVRMDRGAVADGVKLVRLDEETAINETLLELLRTEFQIEIPGISPLPTDKSGVDVPLVLDIFRQAIKEREGWEVHPVAMVGRFSFGKFVMWHDLTVRKDDLAKNPLVAHLMHGEGTYDDGVEAFPESEVASRIDPAQLFCPMSADSSQLAAVLYSALGKSFVLHGPPGTGKSQTITNIIAHNLALGRRVLFVSEKKAALDVVHRRLVSSGLGPFCLELHSNKAGKADVMRQFADALEVGAAREPDDWSREAQKIQSLRSELDGHVRELHRVFPGGLSAYHCLAWLLNHAEDPDFAWTLPEALTQPADTLDRMRGAIRDLAAVFARTPPEAHQALDWLGAAAPPDWSPVWERSALANARRLRGAVAALRKGAVPVAEAFALPVPDTLTKLRAFTDFARTARDAGTLPASLLDPSVADARGSLDAQLAALSIVSETAAKFPDWDVDSLAKLDGTDFLTRFEAVRSAPFFVRLFKKGAFLKYVQTLRKDKSLRPTLDDVAALDGGALFIFTQYAKNARDGNADARRYLGDLLPAAEAPSAIAPEALVRADAAVKSACALAEGVCHVVPDEPDVRKGVFTKLREILPSADTRLAEDAPLRADIDAFLSAWDDFSGARDALVSSLPCVKEDSRLSVLDEHAAAFAANQPLLRDALACRVALFAARREGLGAFAERLESGAVAPEDLSDFFETALRRSMLDAILEQSPLLCRFNGLDHEARIRRFSELDERYLALSRQMVFAKLAARLPARRFGPCPEGTELGLLKRECAKKARQKPVRLLLEQTPTLTPLLKPCFLMSPLSVAQYLPPDAAPFDLVVFDEASQIPVWDAIGVLARAKQHIVVGDPKQMPPTNFFQKGDADLGESFSEDDVEDMESILDECLAIDMFSSYLDWHYRSRHESLIAFSNHYYYGDRLSTFPAAATSDRLGVRFHFVEGGVYDRRRTRTNEKEARALVDYVVSRLLASGARPRSVGIVTFSEAQRNLVEDLIDDARSKDKRLDALLAEETDEPLFVKNLENVQGDERDVILFSVGYAPDAEGKFSMNFGPLNRQGGERRLNVAITRAKEQVVVFSSVHGSDIDLARTAAVGALHLRYFLDYAEKGFGIPAPEASESAGEGLGAAVADFLASQDWNVEREIGASGCRIDVAVRHPDRPDEYLLGILCDGPGYAAQSDTRDRDHLRESVLRGMGWRLAHVWTVDWALDRRRAEERLLAALDEALKAPPPAPPPPPAPEPPSAQNAEPKTEAQEAPVTPTPLNRRPYTPWHGTAKGSQESFYDPAMLVPLRCQIAEIINAEGPIRESLLKRRLARAWGFTRVGNGIADVIERALPYAVRTTDSGNGRVFWRNDQEPGDWPFWRVAENEEDKRELADIPTEEIANVMSEILDGLLSCEQDVLYRETLRALGFNTLTNKARPLLDAALALLRKAGKV